MPSDRAEMMPRRSTLRYWLSLLGVATAGWPAARGTAQTKVSQTDAKYQDHPHGQQRCQICLQFEPPSSCKIVQGSISPQGWCQFFAARENAH